MRLHSYRVAASCFEPDINQNIDIRRKTLNRHITELLNEQSPDLLVLPEIVIIPDFDRHNNCGAETLNGPTVEMISKIAKNFTTNLCIPIIEIDNCSLYNTAVYVDRRGIIAGKYRKHVPTAMEAKRGISPWKESQKPTVLDGLRICTAICFDENYPDLIWNCIVSGVDMLIFPSYTYGGNLMRYWALSCGVPLVCAFPWESVIYDRDGTILAKAGTFTDTVRFGNHSPWITCNINLNRRVYHLDGNQNKLKAIAAKYGAKVDVRLMIRDARVMITVNSDDIELDCIEQEMELLPLHQYLRESRENYNDRSLKE